jgi:hypothetical protein
MEHSIGEARKKCAQAIWTSQFAVRTHSVSAIYRITLDTCAHTNSQPGDAEFVGIMLDSICTFSFLPSLAVSPVNGRAEALHCVRRPKIRTRQSAGLAACSKLPIFEPKEGGPDLGDLRGEFFFPFSFLFCYFVILFISLIFEEKKKSHLARFKPLVTRDLPRVLLAAGVCTHVAHVSCHQGLSA